jgi:hypothetical protein
MANALSVSDLISVSLALTPTAASQPNTNTMLIIGSSDVIDTSERMRQYSNITGVATDFSSVSPEYLAALSWFGQNPAPTTLFIGRWAKIATRGKLVGGRLLAANQLMTAWTGITNGAFRVTLNGILLSPTGMNFSSQTNLNGVASVIQAALITAGAAGGTTVVWNSSFQRFEIESSTTGASSTVSVLTNPASGVDISTMMAMTVTSSGVYTVGGIVAETALSAVEILDVNFGTQWYGCYVPEATDADALQIAAFIEASGSKHFFWVTTSESGTVSAIDTSSLPYILEGLGYNRTAIQYSGTNPNAVMSLAARILTTQWNQPGSAITLMYKLEPGVTAESLNESQMNALLAKNCNVFVNYDNGTSIIQPGICCSGQFIDTVVGADWFAGRIKTDVFNLLYTTPTKIPQTDEGSNMIANRIESACNAMLNNGWLAPGQWNGNGIGQIKSGNYLAKGYYVYYPPTATQSESLRSQRISVPFTVLAKLAGAVHTVDVSVTLNP